jgi:serine/threonine-protein kinase
MDDLLFCLVALREGAIDASQLAEAWSARAENPGASVADHLLRRGAIDPARRAWIEQGVVAAIAKAGGDASAALPEVLASALPRAFGGAVPGEMSTPTLTGITPVPGGPHLLENLSPLGASDRYTLSRIHSKGGLGQVWLARDVTLEREVAFKEIRPEHAEEPSILSRFLREARITGRLEHPGIVPVYELSRRPDSGRPFYTMRFIRGRTLREAIAEYHAKQGRGESTPLDFSALLTAFLGAANTVAYAHANGVIHRDLKGDNVIVGDFGEVIVLDWGLAKAIGDADDAPATETRTVGTVVGQVMGTPSYMSPEQAAGRTAAVGTPSDVYSLGAILFEILTGRAPVSGDDVDDIVRRAATETRPRARSIRRDAPRALDAVCAKALALDPADRYPTASELAGDVRRFLADEPVGAWREPWTVRSGRWARRHKPLVAGATALLTTAVLALSVGTVVLGRKNREIERARATAESNFQLAKGAVDRYLTRVGDSPELRTRGLESLRTTLFESAREFYDTFVKQRSGDPASRIDLASAHINLGNISRLTGDTKRAEESYGRAIAIYDELGKTTGGQRNNRLAAGANLALLLSETGRPKEAEDAFRRTIDDYEKHPAPGEEPAYTLTASNAYENLGTLYLGQRRLEECEKLYGRALELRERLLKAHPGEDAYRNSVVMIHGNLSNLYASTGREAEAEKHLVAAIEIGEALVQAHSDDPEYQKNLSALLNNLGGSYTLTGRLSEARAAHERALALREKLVAEHPAVMELQLSLAGSLINVGELAIREEKFEAGLKSLQEADDVLGRILAKEPRHTAGRFYTAYAASWRARGLDGLKRFDDGNGAWRRAAEFNDQRYPTIPAGYARAIARRGDFKRALVLAKSIEAAPGMPPDALYDLAAVSSLASAWYAEHREPLAAHAVALLGKAAAMGFFKTPGAAESALRDPDFAAIASREDFRKVVGKR